MQSYPYDVLDVASRGHRGAPELRSKRHVRWIVIAAIAALVALGAGVAVAANAPFIAYDQPAIDAPSHLPIVPAAPGVHEQASNASSRAAESDGPHRIGSSNPSSGGSRHAERSTSSNAFTGGPRNPDLFRR